MARGPAGDTGCRSPIRDGSLDEKSADRNFFRNRITPGRIGV